MTDVMIDADIIIQNGTIITMDPQRRIIEKGAVVIQNGKIEAVGKLVELTSKYEARKKINAEDKAVLPGLVNTHTHLFQNLYKGLGDDKGLEEWLNTVTLPLSVHLTEEDCYVAALAGCLEAIKSGTTCTLDFMYIQPRPNLTASIIQALEVIGIRGICGHGTIDMGEGVPPELIEDTDKGLAEIENVIKKYNGTGDGRIRVWPAPCTVFLASPELLKGCRDLANKYGTGISIHIEETLSFIEYAEKAFRMRELDFLNSIGFLGPDVLAVHCVWLDDRNIRLLQSLDVKVSHNPISNMYTGAGVAPIPRMIESGLTVGLGVDGAASNNNQDLMAVLKVTALLHKVHSLDATVITADKVLEMATIDGAKSLSLQDEIGSLEPGKKADIILVNLKSPNIVPSHHPVSSLIYSATGSDVDTVIIDGKIIMEDREIKTVDETELMNKTRKIADSLVERAGLTLLKKRKWQS